ncbi:MAG: MBL fold metallo-hydrolase [Candidatus Aenigmarchaeota archaeon]|nr:MBL fold metallo-hydrolase [Candidatus Aenigmarchaeota archaeon]
MLKNIVLIRDPDCNIYLLDQEILIDTGTGRHFSEIKKFIEADFNASKIKAIINTHCHYDHTGGDKKFRDWLGADILIHKNDADALENATETTAAALFNVKAKAVTVDRKLANNDTINTKNFSLKVIHTPGHTSGSICLYDKNNNFMITGDTLFADAFGRTDLPTGNEKQMKESLEKILGINPKHIFPGHGNPKSNGIDFLIKQLLNKIS